LDALYFYSFDKQASLFSKIGNAINNCFTSF
jgi:hypothetical protein